MLGKVRTARSKLPENVRTLGSISLANDAASEFAYPIIPLFLTLTLGAPVLVVGLIEGVAEACAIVFKFLSGWLSDKFGERRRPWIVAGYSISTVARAGIALAPGWGVVLGAKIVDRIGKGTRGTPRDALIKDSTPKLLLGAAFGYHRAMDTAGAIVGPLIAVALLEAGLSLRTILWVAVVPGLLTLVLVRRVREADEASPAKKKVQLERVPLPAGFWAVLAIWMVFSLGNSSDVFLLLRAGNLGLGAIVVVLAYALYNLVYASLSWPLGALSDRLPRHLVLAGGVMVFALVYLGFAVAPAGWVVYPLFAVYGVYVAATEGVARAWVADHVGEHGAGTAFGVFSLGTAVAALVASIVAGILWTSVGPEAPFVMGAVTATIAAVLLLGYSLTERVGSRPAKLVVAGLGAAVLFGAGFEHASLGVLLRGSDAADALPLAPAQSCPAPPRTVALRHPLLDGFPKPAGVAYTGLTQAGPRIAVSGFATMGVASARAAYAAALPNAGFGIASVRHDPTESEIRFTGGVSGEIRLTQPCRNRTLVTVRLGGAD